jgi:hypothetical protein
VEGVLPAAAGAPIRFARPRPTRTGRRRLADNAPGERAADASRGWLRGAPRGDYDGFAPDIARAYRRLGLPPEVDADEVAKRELRWWVVRREIGLAAGEAAGDAITRLYASLYQVPESDVAKAGRLRGMAAEVRDRGATTDPDGSTGQGRAYWPEVARLLRDSYRSLKAAVDGAVSDPLDAGR